MADPRLILTCGLPGSGKTTLADTVARTRPAVRLTPDEWLFALGTTPWDEEARERLEQQLANLAWGVLRCGASVIIDFGLWARSERDAFRLQARERGVGVELHYLDVELDELWRRVAARNAAPPWSEAPISRDHLVAWSNSFERPNDAEVALFDAPLALS